MELIVVRGAITVPLNTRESILSETTLLLETILEKNNIVKEDIYQITFTATKDLDAVYPAVAARNLNITEAALVCMQEMYVVGSLEKCIRIALMSKSPHPSQGTVLHQYLKGASILRPDLITTSKED